MILTLQNYDTNWKIFSLEKARFNAIIILGKIISELLQY